MGAFNTIAFDAAKCDGCGDCMTACATAKVGSGDTARSRIQIVGSAEDGFELALCRQCADPKCVTVCPAAALTKNYANGVIDWNADKCVDCLLCTVGCAYAGIALDAEHGHVAKCDMCEGSPACVPACPHDALTYVTTSRIYNEVGDWEDLFAPGLAGCQGCNTELLMRHTLRRVGPDTVLATPPGCVPGMGSVGFNGTTGTKIPVFHPLLTNTAAMLAGVKRQYKRVGRDVTALAIAGDGGASDVGFQSLSGAAERNEQILFMVVDNEGYMNTGMQRSSCTPYGAWTSTTPVGQGTGRHALAGQDAGRQEPAADHGEPPLRVRGDGVYRLHGRPLRQARQGDPGFQARLCLPARVFALHHRLALPDRPEHGSGEEGRRNQFRHAVGVQPDRRPALHQTGR
jgi:phenylglyoxylate dehydrogenase beta subunit